MDTSRFTEKAQDALVQAQRLAAEHSHGQVEGDHLLLALLRQTDGVVPQIVQGLGLQSGLLAQQVEAELARRPKVYGATAQIGLSREAARALDRAEALARQMHDDYVSTEHLLVSLSEEGGGSAERLLRASAGNHDQPQGLRRIDPREAGPHSGRVELVNILTLAR